MSLNPSRCTISALLALLAAALFPAIASAAEDGGDLEARVARALDFTSLKLTAKTENTALTFHWIGSERFWFKKTFEGRPDAFLLVEAATGRQEPLFDPAAMALALEQAGAPKTGDAPRLHDASVSGDGRSITVDVPAPDATCRWPQLYDRCTLPVRKYRCDLPVTACAPSPGELGADVVGSPDGRYLVSVRDHNLWLHDRSGGADRRLTADGVANFAYGEVHDQIEAFAASRRRAGLPEPMLGVRWSPDGRYILALRYDVRPFRDLLVLTEYLPPEGGPPIIHTKRQAEADDKTYPAAQLSVISVADGTVRQVDVDPHLFDDIAGRSFTSGTLWWNMARDEMWLIGARRGGLEIQLLHVDLAAGKARTVISETAKAPVVLHPAGAPPNIAILPKERRLVWYSERDGWGHLYLHDLDSGRMIRQLTKGQWLVTDLVRADEDGHALFFSGSGREPGENPYFRHLYKIGLDGGTPRLLTPEAVDHDILARSTESGGLSPDGRYVIDDMSSVTQPDRYVLRGDDGHVIAPVAEAGIAALRETGWKPPEPFSVKAADGATDLYGVIYKPGDFDPARKYPIIEITYPGSWSKYAPTTFRGVFYGSAVMNAQAYAELGAIVVSVDGRGTSYRSAEFRNHYYLKDDATGAEDHVAAIRNLAATRPWMDLTRIGVTGHSSGGDGSLRAMMLHPDFFKVAVSGEGPTDYFGLPMDIAIERPEGVPDTAEGKAYYERIATRNMVGRLTSANKVLVIYAGADEEVPLQQGFELFRAFQDAGFVYDELIVPDAGHWGGRHPYGVMRTARYFAEHLGGPR